MPKLPQKFFRQFNQFWYVTIKGRQFNLGHDKDEAELKYAKLISQHRPPSLDAPVAVLLDRFLEWAKLNRAGTTYQFYKEILDSFKESIGGRLKVDDLRPYHIETWKDTRYAKASDNYKHNLIRGIQRCFSWAVRQRYLDRSPVQHIEKPQQTPREVFINTTQWAVLLKKIPDQQFRDLLTILWESGCRPLEARKMEAFQSTP